MIDTNSAVTVYHFTVTVPKDLLPQSWSGIMAVVATALMILGRAAKAKQSGSTFLQGLISAFVGSANVAGPAASVGTVTATTTTTAVTSAKQTPAPVPAQPPSL